MALSAPIGLYRGFDMYVAVLSEINEKVDNVTYNRPVSKYIHKKYAYSCTKDKNSK